MTLKELIRKAVDELVKKGKEEFTTEEIYQEAMKIDPSRKRESILAALSALVVGRKHHFYTREDQFLEKVRRGVYKLYDEDRNRRKREEASKLLDGVIIMLEGEGFSDEEIAEMLEERVKRLRGEIPELLILSRLHRD
ncbi:MAG: hypothetical protein DRJ51_05900 [Thermoprotei archaeon]|nr:MAG: hypothetical protein DRP77_07090 [Candidatus Poribacteria bacterium]RLE80403.1 MAG: hypothetical protein DRJ51_05900 [Thermoprotei archaeon]